MAPRKAQPQKQKNLRGTERERAILKIAKRKGLIKVDLRKPLSDYARAKVDLFEPLLEGRAAVVKLPRGAKPQIEGVSIHRGRAMVLKDEDERIRFDKKTRQIKVSRDLYNRRGEKIKTETRELQAQSVRLTITFNEGSSGRQRRRTFSGKNAWKNIAAYMKGYKNYQNWQRKVEIEYV